MPGRKLLTAPAAVLRCAAARWYLLAGLCLILSSAGLRFYGLTEHGLRFDELMLARTTGGSFGEVFSGFPVIHPGPVLYPLALWMIQKIDASLFSIRLLPAVSGVLTTAALLWLLPRAGLNRRAAFFAALAATLGAHLLFHSQDAREYGVDALLATLLAAGLLGHLRDGRQLLLGFSLFLAPLVQYGLVLFGAAALAVVCFHCWRFPPPYEADERPIRFGGRFSVQLSGRWPGRLRQFGGPARLTLCFLAGGLLSYAVTPFNLGSETPYYANIAQHYLQDGYSPGSIIGYAVKHTWAALSYLLPPVIAIVALVCLARFLLSGGARLLESRRRRETGESLGWGGRLLGAAGRRRGTEPATEGTRAAEQRSGNAVIALLLLTIAIAVLAGVLNLHPFGYVRQSLYLGPVVFLAAGVLLHSAINWAVGLFPRRNWAAAALFLAVCGLLLGFGALDLQQRDRSFTRLDNYDVIVPLLQEKVRDEDIVVSYFFQLFALEFHLGELPGNYYRAPNCNFGYQVRQTPRCIRYAVSAAANLPERIWFVSESAFPMPDEFAKWSAHPSVQPVIPGGEQAQLHLITNLEAGWLERYEAITAGEPVARAGFEVYLDDNKLHYAKEPCAPSDTADTFLLHLIPAEVGDLPEWRRGYDFDNLDFQFDETYLDREVYAARFDGKCLASVPLPDYPISEIRTGQLRPDGTALWRVDFAPNPELVQQFVQQAPERPLADDYRAVVSGPPAARAVFAMYLDGRTLHYAKEPCGPADTEATFLLHLIPQDADDLPEEGSSRFYGFENRDFTFTDHGAEFGGVCLASVPLPDYPIAVIRTGQYLPDGQRLWMTEFPAGR